MACSDGAVVAVALVCSIFALVLILLVRWSVRIVNHAEVMIVEKFGKYHRTLMPGLHFILPLVEQVRDIDWRQLKPSSNSAYASIEAKRTNRIDLREHVIDFGRQHVITKDTVMVDIDALVYFRITDPRLAVFKIQNIPDAIEFLTQATLRNIIASMTLDDTFSSREEINSSLLKRIQPDVERWGVFITRVEIFNIIPPNDIKLAMEQQIKAERDRRSEVLRADGERESRIINSRGNAAKTVLYAEGVRAATMLKAKGEAEARLTTSKAEAHAMEAVQIAMKDSNVRAVDYLTSIQYLNNLREVTRQTDLKSNVVMVPVDTMNGINQLIALNSKT